MSTKSELIKELIHNFSNYENIKRDYVEGIDFLPVSGKVIDHNEIEFIIESALDGWLTSGKYNDKFENDLKQFIGIKNLITVNSGSSANLIAFYTLTSPLLGKKAIKKNDEIITVAAGFPTTINPFLQFGCKPVFIDIDLKTLNISADLIENSITNKTRAIMIAHTLGNPFDLKIIKDICDKYNLWLIEDCCDSLGSKYENQHVGTFGDMATLSFYPAHHITMGEGGAVFTNNNELIKIAESFRDWGRDCYCKPGKDNTCNKRFCWKLGDLPYGYDHKYIYSHCGFNLKITDMQAACGLSQLNKLNSFIEKRKSNYDFLKNELNQCSEFISFQEKLPESDPSWFGFAITLKSGTKFNRSDILNYLNQKKIGTRLLFAGNITKQPYMKYFDYKAEHQLINTDKIMNDTFWLGVYPGLSKKNLTYIADSIKEFLGINF